MFSEKELNLEESDLRQQIAALSTAEQERYHRFAAASLKSPATYALLNWLFLLGAHHFYLRRWLRGVINLTLTLIGVYLLITQDARLYAGVLFLAVAIIEVPQLLNYEHIVHAFNNRTMRACLKRAQKALS